MVLLHAFHLGLDPPPLALYAHSLSLALNHTHTHTHVIYCDEQWLSESLNRALSNSNKCCSGDHGIIVKSGGVSDGSQVLGVKGERGSPSWCLAAMQQKGCDVLKVWKLTKIPTNEGTNEQTRHRLSPRTAYQLPWITAAGGSSIFSFRRRPVNASPLVLISVSQTVGCV